MKLVRYRSATGEKPGLILDGETFDLSAGFAALSHRLLIILLPSLPCR